MKYHAPTQQFTIDQRALLGVSMHLRYAIMSIRKQAGLPLTPHKHDGPMETAQFAEKALLDVAGEIGIDMGADWPGKLDVSDAA
ncbi:hypothetical protein PY254_10445 [Rhodanobacter sp. AS-Z3]|uniref:hypothetical protein n=1 Tax=Rhodanobacter sp. AS-Z3 TaxID=3031330 RepID=UPI0024796E63|nr:hypothetical protein [Rhodanobacter sp. AS-Z3]WEN13665.1 hypothetical protein PY254_10445 [Rhodanobacter sp. AS-Z3]